MTLLGDLKLERKTFSTIDATIERLKGDEVAKLNGFQKLSAICHALVELIEAESTPCFLLPHVVDYCDRVTSENIFQRFHFAFFEFWLNQHSGFSDERNYAIRGRIAGKHIPREQYQSVFPVGMDKVYEGSHIVTAHGSPDLDTIVSAFWGWLDAFSCRVGKGLHRWNVPGGRPNSVIELELLFDQIFGASIFEFVAKKRTALSLNTLDLMTQRGHVKRKPMERSYSLDYQRSQSAVVCIDEEGYYMGDWRAFDVEGVRDVINAFNICMRWLESHLHKCMIELFAKSEVTAGDFKEMIDSLRGMQIAHCEPIEELTERQKEYVAAYVEKVLKIKEGLQSTILAFLLTLEEHRIGDFSAFRGAIEALEKSKVFDESGKLREDRPEIFSHIQEVFGSLSDAFHNVREYTDSLKVALEIKKEVFGFSPNYLPFRTDIEEIRSKMASYPYLTVAMLDHTGKRIPLGVIHSHDLQKQVFGTVSLRDFSNRDETKIPPYLDIISVIDHHKVSISSLTPPKAIVSDAQSSNVLMAKMSFEMNDIHSTGGMSEEALDAQIQSVKQELSSAEMMRILERLLKKKRAANCHGHFISHEREVIEYLHYMYAIFDDTDLLTKMTRFDVVHVAQLINRLKSIQEGREVEVIHFDDLECDPDFVAKASERLLQNKDVYSLYAKVYTAREAAVTANFERCAKGETSAVFTDTKTQNACARVGQTKMFVKNVQTYQKHEAQIRQVWVEQSQTTHNNNSDIDLYLHMISTIASAEELHTGKKTEYWHKDELWMWIPGTDLSVEHLTLFLSAFKESAALDRSSLELELIGPDSEYLDMIFNESFLTVPHKVTKEGPSMAILRYKAGTLNSRKAMISPFLPKI